LLDNYQYEPFFHPFKTTEQAKALYSRVSK